MSPTAFHHLAIQVRDLRAAEEFYCGLLGLQVLRRWPWPAADQRAGERSLWLALGAGFLALESCEGSREDQAFKDLRPGLHLLALRIDAKDRALWEQRFSERGVTVVHRSAFTLYILDPEGNRVGLSHHPDEG